MNIICFNKRKPPGSWLHLSSRFIDCRLLLAGFLSWWCISHIPSDHRQRCWHSVILVFLVFSILSYSFINNTNVSKTFQIYIDSQQIINISSPSFCWAKGAVKNFIPTVFFLSKYPGGQRISRLEITSETPYQKYINFIRLFQWVAPSPHRFWDRLYVAVVFCLLF